MNLCAKLPAKHKLRCKLCYISSNVLYLISCKLCKEEYVGSAFKGISKPSFRVYKSDVITGKDKFSVAKHFLTKCTNSNKVENTEVQLIEQVQEGNYDLEGKLWCREKYWQAQLRCLSRGMIL